jgi:hypothetical protein
MVKLAHIAVSAVLFALLFPTLSAATGNTTVALALSASVSIAILFVRKQSGGDAWEAIPRRDYLGRHAELGGLARDEQEGAVEEIHENADETEPRHRDR